jgi:hypothetical protein
MQVLIFEHFSVSRAAYAVQQRFHGRCRQNQSSGPAVRVDPMEALKAE